MASTKQCFYEIMPCFFPKSKEKENYEYVFDTEYNY